MTGFRPPFPQGDASEAYVAELLRREEAREALVLEDDGENFWCGDCGCLEGEIHMEGCDTERCPWCGGQLISCECSHRLLGIPGDGDLTERQAATFQALLEDRGRVPFVLWPVLCARCGTKWPPLYRSKVGAEEWDRYVRTDRREAWLCELCFARIKRLVDGRCRV